MLLLQSDILPHSQQDFQVPQSQGHLPLNQRTADSLYAGWLTTMWHQRKTQLRQTSTGLTYPRLKRSRVLQKCKTGGLLGPWCEPPFSSHVVPSLP